MSDDERSDSSSDSQDVETTGLIATRAKRATAGNLYATLRANLDDEELQKELLAEDEEEDAGDYEGSDRGDDDDELESSSDDEDAGPPKEGEAEDLDGEKALKRQERVEAQKKRKAHDARLKLPAWQKAKRVKLADDVKTEDGSTSERPRKKSERSNWLPTAADAPIRQSGRQSAVANREIVHANLKQSAARSEKQRRVMKVAAEREKDKRRMVEMTQEERLRKCERIERETAKEFGRWEREEAERQRARDAALAAKRKRGVDGPFMRHWSGSVLWVGDRIKVRRMSHGSRKVEEMKLEKEKATDGSDGPAADGEALGTTTQGESGIEQHPPTQDKGPLPDTSPGQQPSQLTSGTAPIQDAPVQASSLWLQGIQEYAAQPESTPEPLPKPTNISNGYTPSAPSINDASTPQPPPNQQQPQIYHGWPPGTHSFAVETPPTAPPPPPPAPLIREQAQRTLIMLEHFPSLDNTSTKRTPKYKQIDTSLDSSAVKDILLPGSFPTAFTSEEQKYLITRPRRKNNEVPLPSAPAKQRCAITSWVAKFRDPKTGLAYADMHQYKAIQRILAGGTMWSGLLGCWVGPKYGAIGRPAKGVPEGFAGLPTVKKEGAS